MIDPAAVPIPVVRARTLWQRFRGLLAGPPLPAGHAMLFDRCRAVHTLGMRRAIDVVFVAADGRIVEVMPRVRSGRFAACRNASAVLELAAGDAWRLGLQPGRRIEVIDRGVRR